MRKLLFVSDQAWRSYTVQGIGLRPFWSWVKMVRRFLHWLAISYQLGFTKETIHQSRAPHSGPCNRGAIKKTHQACVSLEEVASVPEAERDKQRDPA